MRFKTYLDIRCLQAHESDFRYQLLSTLTYQTKDGEWIYVPIGYLTDFASVPWFFRRFIPKTGRYNEATVVHDYLCQLSNKGRYSRKRADKIFLECMEALGCKKWRMKLMYRGVSTYTFFKRGGKK